MKLSIFDQLFRLARIQLLYFRVSVQHLNVYRLSTYLSLILSIAFLIGEILTVNIYYHFTDQIGDWDKNSFYILLGTFNICTCLYICLFEIAHDDFIYKLKYGELDIDLSRPIDAQLWTALHRVDLASLLTLPIPIWLVVKGSLGVGHPITPVVLILYVASLGLGVVIIYLVNQFFVNWGFWIVDASSLTHASQQVVQLGARPLEAYPQLIQWGFSYVIPIILCMNCSVNILQHQARFMSLLVLAGAAALFFMIVRIQWNLGLRNYTSAS